MCVYVSMCVCVYNLIYVCMYVRMYVRYNKVSNIFGHNHNFYSTGMPGYVRQTARGRLVMDVLI